MLHVHGGTWSQVTGVHINPYTYAGNGLSAQNVKQIGGERVNRFIGETFARTSATPDGYTMGAWVLPVKAGGMSSWQAAFGMSEGAGDLLQGGPMEGTATFGLSGAGDMSLITSLAGTATFGMDSATSSLALTIGLEGTATFGMTGDGALSLIVPLEGTGELGMTGAGDLRGILSMEGSWGGATPLSPEALAQAVWAELNSNGDAYGAVVTNTEKQAKLAVALSA